MNVLVDRHHSGLFRSLQLLGDRLGWTLYTTIGTEWMDERYWMFGMNQGLTDVLAQQYLVPHDGVWEAKGVRYVTEDPEFPGVEIVGIPLDVARAMRWDLIIATLDDNQWGFSRFAHEQGARFVVQAGNTNQHIAWNLDPIALVSSEVPILGRGVRYHQEMDAVMLVPRWPAEAQGHAASFVNCMPSMGGDCWAGITEAQSLGFRVDVHGIDGPAGVIKPISAIADRMAAASWGWHCKRHGDGYGHVVFGWAAIGRPLVGHASHYAGKMAEPLWRHGETCIDLDRVSVVEAVETMRTMGADEHARMCHAIRDTFHSITDNGRDAANIADLLGIGSAVAG